MMYVTNSCIFLLYVHRVNRFCLSWSVLYLFISCEAVATSASTCSRAGLEQEEQDEIVLAQVSLLQGVQSSLKLRPLDGTSSPQLTVSKPRMAHKAILSHPPSPTDYLQAAMPLAWTHIPKCGSSLLNSLVRLPAVCPGVPVGDKIYGGPNNISPNELYRCEGLNLVGGAYGHINVGSMYEHVYHNHGVIMLRQPEQRVISMYNHHVRDGSGIVAKYNMTVADFANATAGCEVRMMTKDGRGWEGCEGVNRQLEFIASLKVSDSDVVMAQERLHGYAFVGITEYWAESICLFACNVWR